MDKITRAEYRILRACAHKPREYEPKQISHLLHNRYLRPRDIENVLGVMQQTSNYYEITHDGRLAYEHYHEHIFEYRMVSFRAWLALALSAISIVVTVIHYFMG